LLPHLAAVAVASVDTAGPVVVVHARTRSEEASACSGCGNLSDWVHSRYTRRLADTAVGGRPARIELEVRRLYCENSLCPKATFAEQVDGLTVRYQRRTPLLQRLVEIAGVLLAGRGGARLLRLVHAGLSRTSVLSHLMKIPLPTPTAPRVLGVDDFALYGRTYGTLLVDEETRLPITLWQGRDAETLRDWLLEHPGVQIALAGTAHRSIARASPAAPRTPSRSATDSTSGRACPGESSKSPPCTAAA
jgi:transposase